MANDVSREPPVNALVQAGQLSEAQALWRLHCPDAGTGLVADGALAKVRPASARTNFEWDMVGSSDIGLVLVPGVAPGSQAVEMHNGASFTRIVLRQMLVLPPGSYRLNWTAETSAGKPSAQIVAAIGCMPEAASPLLARSVSGSAGWGAEVNIGAECPAHWLVFSLQPGADDVKLSQIRLTKL